MCGGNFRIRILCLALVLMTPLSWIVAMERFDDFQSVATNSKHFSGKCRRVVDGDSLYLEGLDTQVRLWGVDAPERDETGYSAAKKSLNRMAYGKLLRCEQQDIDKYKRIVARCFVVQSNANTSSLELNSEQLRLGVAQEYCRFTRNHYGYCRK